MPCVMNTHGSSRRPSPCTIRPFWLTLTTTLWTAWPSHMLSSASKRTLCAAWKIVEPSPIERTNDPSGLNSSSGWLPRFSRKMCPFELSATPTASDGQILSGSLKKSSSRWKRSCGAAAAAADGARPPPPRCCPRSGTEKEPASASAGATTCFIVRSIRRGGRRRRRRDVRRVYTRTDERYHGHGDRGGSHRHHRPLHCTHTIGGPA